MALDTLTGNSLGQLQNLQDMYAETALGHGTGPLQRRMLGFGALPPAGFMPSPMAMMPGLQPYCGCGYAGIQKMDLAPGSTNIPFFSKLMDPRRRMAGNFERMLRHNPAARAAFEAQIGGRIVDFGFRNDGKFKVQRFSGGYHPMGMMGMSAMNPMAGAAMAHYGALSASSAGLGMGFGINPFMGFMAGAMNRVMGFMGLGMGGMGGMGFGGLGGAAIPGSSGPGGGFFDNSGVLGGRGFGSWNPLAMPGRINNTNPAYESAHQAQVAGILNDPSLTVEDRVTLMIMLIMNKMDKDIQNQAEYINSIQQQQSKRGGGGGKGGKGGKGGFMGIGGGKGKGGSGGPFGGANGGNNAPSIDVETMKLKRMIDKRSQMFDMLRQIIDKYNQTAKGIIDSIGR